MSSSPRWGSRFGLEAVIRQMPVAVMVVEAPSLSIVESNDADVMMAHPLALQLRNLQSLVEIAVDKNSTVVFPAPLMSTIGELGAFLARESKAAGELSATPDVPTASTNGELVPHDRHQPA